MSDQTTKPQQSTIGTSLQIVGLIAWLAIVFAAAAIGNLATTAGVRDWYPLIAKPSWTPPNWVFGPVWTALYIMMGVAAWLVWRRGGFVSARSALTMFLIQLALNSLWSILFFTLRQPTWAAIEIALLWVSIAATIVMFLSHSRTAAWLMMPYLLWVSYAAALNITIAAMNG